MANHRDVTVPVRVVAELPLAWRHQCGRLNEGPVSDGTFCAGCRSETRPNEIEARFLLVEVGI